MIAFLFYRDSRQRTWASFPPKTQLNGLIAKEGTLSHFIELTIDQFCGCRVLYKHPMFIHYCDYTVEAALLDVMSKSKTLRHLNTLEINVCTNRCLIGYSNLILKPRNKSVAKGVLLGILSQMCVAHLQGFCVI